VLCVYQAETVKMFGGFNLRHISGCILKCVILLLCEYLFSMQCTVVLVSACLVVDVAPDSLGKPWTNEFLFVENHKAGTDCTVRSESRCALRLRYVDLVVSVEVAVEVCCCFTVFSC
jgi:hypothetical protein